MDELQKYLFDLQGYLVIEDALTDEEVATLNELISQQDMSTEKPGRPLFAYAGGGSPTGPGFLAWGQALCDLLDHEAIMPVLRFRLGDCFRLDRLYGILMRKGMTKGKLHSDYGASSPIATSVPGEYYQYPVNELHSGFAVVSWNLTESGPGIGGFCCIPGSHKSNYRLPQELVDAGEDSRHVVIPRAPAGSVTVFTEALTHGTTSWNAEHERRTLLFKYCVSQMAWGTNRVEPPADHAITPRQRLLFAEPAEPYRFFPSLFDGTDCG